MILAVNGYPLSSYSPIVKLRTGSCENKGEQENSQRKSRKTMQEMKDYPNLCFV